MRTKSAWESGLGFCHEALGWDRFRCAEAAAGVAAAPLGHELTSPEGGTGAPLDCEVEVAMVEVEAEEREEVEDEMEDDELFLCRLFRGMRTRLSSSGFIIWPAWLPLIPFMPQVGRLCWVKVGGLATAVMREVGAGSGAGAGVDRVDESERAMDDILDRSYGGSL